MKFIDRVLDQASLIVRHFLAVASRNLEMRVLLCHFQSFLVLLDGPLQAQKFIAPRAGGVSGRPVFGVQHRNVFQIVFERPVLVLERLQIGCDQRYVAVVSRCVGEPLAEVWVDAADFLRDPQICAVGLVFCDALLRKCLT
jgi:hypothetical protein